MSAETALGSEVALATARTRRPAAELFRWAALGLFGLLACSAVLLCWRRLDGGLSRPPAPEALAAAGAAIALLAAACRAARRYSRPAGETARVDGAVSVSISVVLLALGAAVSLPGASPWGLLLFWGLLAAEEIWAWTRGLAIASPLRLRRVLLWGRERKARTGHPASQAPSPTAPIEPCSPPADGAVSQQLTRSRSADGGEVFSGWLRVEVAPGQRNTSVHVAFCPPFARVPKATIDQLDGPAARIKTVQLLPYGARFDLKLAAASPTSETLLLQLAAVSKPPQEAEG